MLFCLEKRLSKQKMTIFSKHLGGNGPFGLPGYAYASCGQAVANSVPGSKRLATLVYMNWIDSHSQVEEGSIFVSCRINRSLFADYLLLPASSKQGLQHALDRFCAACDRARMKISTKNTEVWCLSTNQRQCMLQVSGMRNTAWSSILVSNLVSPKNVHFTWHRSVSLCLRQIWLRSHEWGLPFCHSGSGHCQISPNSPLLKKYKTYADLGSTTWKNS